jgi:hypothetical protein
VVLQSFAAEAAILAGRTPKYLNDFAILDKISSLELAWMSHNE